MNEYITFKNLPDTTTPIDATNLNTMQSKIKSDITNVNNKLGNLGDLTTENKDNLVGAINENTSKLGNLGDLTTENKDNLVGAINDCNFIIEKKGDFVYRKYNNGFVEIYQNSTKNVTFGTNYLPSTAMWTNVDYTLPEAIKELYSINTNISDTQANGLMGCCYRSQPTINDYKLFVFDFGQTRTKDIIVYTTITGRWK